MFLLDGDSSSERDSSDEALEGYTQIEEQNMITHLRSFV